MTDEKMVALIGEQPIPNLLPIRYDKPTDVLLVQTERTKSTAERLANVIKKNTDVFFCDVVPYDISAIYRSLTHRIEELGWRSSELVFNLTGGTKPMAFAAYQVVLDQSGQFLYLESERRKSRLRQYRFEEGLTVLQRDEIIPAVITIDDYLKAYLTVYQSGDIQHPFEQILFDMLQPEVDEVMSSVKDLTGTLEIDLVVRIGNQVGIIEAKTGKKATKKVGIDQLNTAGGRAYLGTYTQKFLILDCSWEHLSNLRELAQARYIEIIELPGYDDSRGQLAEEDRQRLIQTIKTKLEDI